MTGVLIQRGEETQRQGGEGHVTMEAETGRGVCKLRHAKVDWCHQGNDGAGRDPPQSPRGEHGPANLRSWPFGHQDCERTDFTAGSRSGLLCDVGSRMPTQTMLPVAVVRGPDLDSSAACACVSGIGTEPEGRSVGTRVRGFTELGKPANSNPPLSFYPELRSHAACLGNEWPRQRCPHVLSL